MNKEESLEILQRAYHAQATGGAPPWDPQFAGSVKTAIDALVVEISKQKMKERIKDEYNVSMGDGDSESR